MKRELYKITRNGRLWKRGQKVWLIFETGALAAYVIGKYRGKGRWIKGWVNSPDEYGKGFGCKPNAKYIGEVQVTKKFNDYLEFLSGHKVRSSTSGSE